MKTILPTQSNYSLIDSDEVIEVAIHTRPLSKGVKIFSGIYLVSLFLTSVFLTVLMRSLILEHSISWFGITLAISVLAAAGIFFIMTLILRSTFQENFIISREAIQVEYEAKPFRKRTYQYLAKHIQGLRVSSRPIFAIWSGKIGFDYGGKTVYFGNSLNESEARQILSVIRTKYEGYDFIR
jgi:hypothetical protein